MSSLVGPDLLEVVGGRQDLPGAAVQVVVEVAGHDGAGAQEIVVLERLCAKWFPFEVSLLVSAGVCTLAPAQSGARDVI